MSTSTMDLVRSGEPMDLYYYDSETARKQAFPTSINTKYVQSFQSLAAGSQTFTIPPQNGIQDVVVEFQVNVATSGTNLALPSGWGYALIKQVSFRYGGSSQYFLTGDQILQLALKRQANKQAMDDIVNLGGNSLVSPAVGSYFANCVLTLPHASPSGLGKAHPFPTDLLTQQVQVTVEVYNLSQIVTNNGGTLANITLAAAQFQVQQVMLNNQADALARRVDMAQNAYAFPAEFVQQKQTIALPSGVGGAGTAPASVVLTGFRSGEVKSIDIWLTRASDYVLSDNGAKAPFNWQLPLSVTMSYAGDIYSRFENESSPLWYLINNDKSPAVTTAGTSAAAAATSILSEWVNLPFAQTFLDEDAHYVLVHGKPITNGIVNLLVLPPTSQTDWVLNVSYVYNTVLLMSQGSCDFIF